MPSRKVGLHTYWRTSYQCAAGDREKCMFEHSLPLDVLQLCDGDGDMRYRWLRGGSRNCIECDDPLLVCEQGNGEIL
jgi:hypothetical protein